jgi:hypothetical protein
MKIKIKNTIDYFSDKPRILFLVDGSGAAITTCSLFFVLRHYYEYFGMPANMLIYLSVIGLVYCVYSMLCCFLLKSKYTLYLRIIATGNLLYCVLTMTLLWVYNNLIIPIGLTYFLVEIVIIVLLAYIELSVANSLRVKNTN